MAVNALQYVKNVGKSFGYSAIDALKEYNPQITALASGAKDLSSELYDTIEDFKGKIKGTNDSDEKGLFDKGKNIVKDLRDNIMDDLKTGNWYNKQRADEADEQVMKDMFGFDESDFDLDDWDFDWDEDEDLEDESEADSTALITSTQKQTANAIIETMDAVGSKSTNAIAGATVKSADYIATSQRQSSRALYSLNQKGFAQVSTGIAAINANISTLVTLGEPLTTHMQNSATFYTQSSEYQKSVLEKLDTIIKNTSTTDTRYKSERKTRFSDLITAEGVIDFTSMLDMLKENVNSAMGEMNDMFEMVGGFDNMVKMMISSPLKLVTDTVTKAFIPKTFENAMKSFNKSLESFFPAALDKFQAATFDGPLGELVNLLKDYMLPSRDFKTSIDPGQYNHGKVDWTGESEMALKEVIPTYLSAITASLTGGPMTQYDYKTGKFLTTTGVKNLYDSRMQRAAQYAGGDFRSDTLSAVKNMKLDKDVEDQITKEVENYFLNAFKKGADAATNINKSSFKPEDFGLSDTTLEILREVLRQYEKLGAQNVANQFASNIRIGQEQYSDEMRDLQYNGGVERYMYNNASVITKGDKNEPLKTSLLGVDGYGNDIFYYLQGIYQYSGKLANNIALFGYGVEGATAKDSKVKGGKSPLKGAPKIKKNSSTAPDADTVTQISNEKTQFQASQNAEEEQETHLDSIAKTIRDNTQWRGDNSKPGQKTTAEAEADKREKERRKAYYEAQGWEYNEEEFSTEGQRQSFGKQLGGWLEKYMPGVGNKIGGPIGSVIENVAKLFSMPGEAFANILGTAESGLYHVIYGTEGSTQKGVFQMLYDKAEGLLDKLDKHFSDKLEFSLKEWVNNFLGSGFAQETKEELSSAGRWIAGKARDITGFNRANEGKRGVGETGWVKVSNESDKAKNKKNGGWKKTKPVQMETPHPENDFAGIQLDAYGREVTKTGVVAVSEGELIIPSDYNPYYHGSNNKQWQLANENRARNQFYGSYAEGGTAGDNTIEYYLYDKSTDTWYTSIDDKKGSIPKDHGKLKYYTVERAKNSAEWKRAKAYKSNGKMDVGRTKRNINVNKVKEDEDFNLRNILFASVSQLGNAIQDFVNAIIPKDEKKEGGIIDKIFNEQQQESLKKANIPQEAVKNRGAMGAGALIGAGASLLTGAVIGPIGGAAIGAGVGLIVKSDAVQKALFGDYEVDENGQLTDKRSGGLLSANISNFIEKQVSSIAGGAGIGAVAGMFMGSPILGAIVGGTIGYASKSEAVQKTLFGAPGKNGEWDEGIISKDLQDRLKKAMPNIGAGALAGLIAGPFGIVGNLVVGSAVGYASSTDKFQDFIFGKKNANGEREGGLTESIQDVILGKKDKNGKREGGILGDFRVMFFGEEKGKKNRKEGIVESVVGIFQKVGNEIRIDSRSLLKDAGNALKDLVSGGLGNTFSQWLNGTRSGRLIGGAVRTAGKAAYGVATAPVRAARWGLQQINTGLERRALRRGFNVTNSEGKMMTAGERLKEARRVGVYSKDNYKYRGLDKYLSKDSLTSEQLDEIQSQLDDIEDPKAKYKQKLETKRESIAQLLSDYGADDKLAVQLLKNLEKDKVDKALDIVDKLGITNRQKNNLIKEIQDYSKIMAERDSAAENVEKNRNDLAAKLGISADLLKGGGINKVKDLVKAEKDRVKQSDEEKAKAAEEAKAAAEKEAEEERKKEEHDVVVKEGELIDELNSNIKEMGAIPVFNVKPKKKNKNDKAESSENPENPEEGENVEGEEATNETANGENPIEEAANKVEEKVKNKRFNDKDFDPDKFIDMYDDVQSKAITKKAAAAKLGMSPRTFDKYAKEYETGTGHFEGEGKDDLAYDGEERTIGDRIGGFFSKHFLKDSYVASTCIWCGAEIPIGHHICPKCHGDNSLKGRKAKAEQDRKEREEQAKANAENPEAPEEGEIPNNETPEEGENNAVPKLAAGAAAAGLGIGHKLLGKLTGSDKEGEGEPEKKTVFNMFGDAIQKVKNKQGEWVDDLSDQETKESTKSNNLLKEGLGSLSHLGATIGGAFGKLKDALFGSDDGSGEKKQGLLSKLFDKFFGEGSYESGIFGFFSKLFGGTGIVKLGKKVLTTVKDIAPGAALIAVIAGAITGKFDDLVAKLTGNELANNESQFIKDKNGVQHRLATDEEGNFIQDEEGNYLTDDGSYVSGWIEEEGTNTSLSSQLQKNLVTTTVMGSAGVAAKGVNAAVKSMTKGSVDVLGSVASSGGLNTVLELISKFLGYIPKILKGVPILSQFADKADLLVTSLFEFISNSLTGLTSSAAFSKFSETLKTAMPVIRAGIAIGAAINGAGEAEQYFEVKEASFCQKVISALVAGINALIPGLGNLIPNKDIIKFLVSIAPKLGIDMSGLEEQQAQLQQEIEYYNSENGTDLTTEEYLETVENKGGIVRKAKNLGKSFVTNVKEKGVIGAAGDAVGSVVSGIGNGIQNFGSSIMSGISNAVSSAGDWIMDKLKNNPITNTAKMIKEEQQYMQDLMDNPDSKMSDMFKFDDDEEKGGLFSGLGKVVRIGARISYFPSAIISKVTSAIGNKISEMFAPIKNSFAKYNNSIEYIDTLADTGDVGAIWDYDYGSAESEGDTNGIFDGILSAGIFIKKVAATPVALFHKVSNSIGNFIDEKLSPFKVNIAAYSEANEKLNEAAENGDATKIMDIEYEGDEDAPLNGIFGGLFNIQKVVTTITTFIAHPFKSIKSMATNAAGGLWDTVKSFFSNNSDEEIEEAEEELYDNGENANGNASTKAGLATVSKGELIVSAKDNPLSGTFNNTSNISGLLGKALTQPKNLNPSDEASIRETLSSHGVSEDKIDKAVSKINNLKGTAGNIANDVKGIISDSIDKDGKLSIGAVVSNTADLFTGKMSESDNKIVSTAGNVISDVKNAFTDSLSTAKENGNYGLVSIVGNMFKSLKGNEDEDDTLVNDEEIEEQDEELEEEYEDYEKAIDEIQKSVKDNDFNKLLKVEYKGDEDSPLSGLFKGMFNIQKLYNAAYALIAQPFESTGGGSGNSSSSSSSNSNSSSSSSSASETVEESSGGWISKLANGFKSFFGIGSGSGLSSYSGGASGNDKYETFVSQDDDKYKNIKYGNSTIKEMGCGPASATMLINYSNPGSITMKDAIKYGKDYQADDGTTANYFQDILGDYGMSADFINGSDQQAPKAMKNQLSNGRPMVLLGRDSGNSDKSKSPFGPTEHYVVATGIDSKGRIIINDPENDKPVKYNSNILNDVSMGVATDPTKRDDVDNLTEFAGGGFTVPDNETTQAVWGYLTSRGYGPAATAGIMGNMYQESGVNPTVIQSGGKGPAAGIVQWENWKKNSDRWALMNKYAQSQGKDWTDLDSQLKFMDAEFTGELKEQVPQAETWVSNLVKDRYGSMEGFKNINDVDEATKGFEETFEQAGTPQMENRYEAAKQYYNLYSGSQYTGAYNGTVGGVDSNGNALSSGSSSVGGILDSIKNVFKNAFAPLLGSSDSSGVSTSYGGTSANGENVYTGLGSVNGTDQQKELVNLMDSKQGQLYYSQDPPRDPDQGVADCSSTVNWAYKKVFGKSIGDNTEGQLNSSTTEWVDMAATSSDYSAGVTNGSGPNLSNLAPGDIMLYSRSGNSNRPYRVGHVEMYAGNNQRLGHGGPNYNDKGTKVTEATKDSARYIGAKRMKELVDAEKNTNNNTTNTSAEESAETTEEAGAGSGLGNVHMPSVSKMTGGGSNATKKSKLRRFSGGASGVDEEDETINTAVATNAETRRAAKEAKDANNEIISLLKTIAKAVQSIATNTEDIPKLGDTLTDYCQAQLATSVAEVQAAAASNDNGKVDPSEDAALRDLMNTLGAIARG